ncbi:hypothetical protein EYF80_009739 [Liparis tanakae]|uniref:Uncharacterized protein n=1 Tax=Liparis tanakae TaxID=230148 RepID=A0A4Z2IQM6_9TELE|nr:hypothetical protein EYF80_009739 [Liparis tanakae]
MGMKTSCINHQCKIILHMLQTRKVANSLQLRDKMMGLSCDVANRRPTYCFRYYSTFESRRYRTAPLLAKLKRVWHVFARLQQSERFTFGEQAEDYLLKTDSMTTGT